MYVSTIFKAAHYKIITHFLLHCTSFWNLFLRNANYFCFPWIACTVPIGYNLWGIQEHQLSPTLSLEIPNSTSVGFFFGGGLMQRFLQISFSNAYLMKLITCIDRPSTSWFVTQIAPLLPCCTDINPLIVLSRLHWSVNFDHQNFFHW